MVNEIKVSEISVEQNSGNIEKELGYLYGDSLSPIDTMSTIPANSNSQTAYNNSKKVLKELVQALQQEVINIKSVGIEIKENDEMGASLFSSGALLPTSMVIMKLENKL